MKDIDAACKPFEKGFREELFDKLYDDLSIWYIIQKTWSKWQEHLELQMVACISVSDQRDLSLLRFY